MALAPFPSKVSNITDKIVIDWFTQLVSTVNSGSGGGGGGAPTNATYVTISNNGTLTAERALAVSDGFNLTDAGSNSTVTLDGTQILERSWFGL